MTDSRYRHLVAVGETMAAVVPDPVVPLDRAKTFRIVTAGAESNTASCASQLGLASSWVSRLGDDPIGRRIAASIARDGVDVSRVRFVEGAPTGVMIKNPQRDVTKVQYYRSGSAASAMSARDLDGLLGVIPEAAILHVTGVTSALSEACRTLVEALVVDRATDAALVSFDVNHRPHLWARRSASDELLHLADSSDVCFVGLDEAQRLWDVAAPADVRALVSRPGLLVVKNGVAGATVFVSDHRIDVPAIPTEVVEPVGAGDAFAGGFLAAFASTGDPRFAARVGHVTARAVLRSASDTVRQPPLTSLAVLADFTESQWATWAADGGGMT